MTKNQQLFLIHYEMCQNTAKLFVETNVFLSEPEKHPE